ncbi:MAG: hypothetical protein H6Q57_2087 [Geobacteraceae bacterium]|jgi:hypothetical protein|nr:hypothetical protein [Geobacteraceae bacterium]
MTTTCNDLVLAHIDNSPAFYARIEEISPDVKPGWWVVKLLVLTHPCQIYTWILEESQINGAPFTMGGTPVVLEKVVSPLARGEAVVDSQSGPTGEESRKGGGKIVAFPVRNKLD